VNHGLDAMTGGQMSVTPLPAQKTTTSPGGRRKEVMGNPLHVSEMLAQIEGSYFISREAVNTKANQERCRASIIKEIKLQMEGYGFNAVEVLGVCPTNWRLSAKEAAQKLEQEVMKEYLLGVKKDMSGEGDNG
jgi:2-oxoglutarate ferredoxin oxidoreductase subunit beta